MGLGSQGIIIRFTPASPASSVQKVTPLLFLQLPCVSSGRKQLRDVSQKWCRPLPIFPECLRSSRKEDERSEGNGGSFL